MYLVSLGALRQLSELRVQHCELPGDALDPGVQASVLVVLCVEVVLVTLPLVLGRDQRVFPVTGRQGSL